ncbi:MAG: MarR family transcriptional regulator [Gallionella sp.]|nr:MarR family transcriptional regulator [Gallionella sp.]MDD4947001.1 MarR family transcriptional regulator [Gallionella sp.]
MKTTIKVANADDFFRRGKEIARLADQGKRIPAERIISFEDPEDLARLITTAKLILFRAVKESPGSITDLSQRLHRDRSAVKRDIDELERIGLVEVEDIPFPGHGRRKEVRAVAEQVLLAM